MSTVRLIRGAIAPEGAPTLVLSSVKPAIPPRGSLKTLYSQLADSTTLDNVDRLQRIYYALDNGGLLPLVDQFVGRFTNKADSLLNIAGAENPVSHGVDWDSALGFVATGPIVVSASITNGVASMAIAATPSKPIRAGMVVIGTGITSNTTTVVSGPSDGGAGTYVLSAPATATNGTASLTVGGWVGFTTPGAGKYLQDSAHVAFNLTGEPGATGANSPFVGRYSGGGDRMRIRFGSGGNNFVRINNTTTTTITTPVIPASGRFIINRPSASRFEVWRNGALVYSNDAATSDGLPGQIIFGRDNNTFQPAAFSSFSIGAGLDATQAGALDRAIAAAS